jgi:O-antigen ligase
MGFVLSVLYLVTYYLTPATVFGPLAAAHVELILAALVFIVSLPTVTKSCILKTPQSLALIGLTIAVFLSMLIGVHWAGGAVQALLILIPNAFGYFLVCLHCNSKKKLQVLVLMMLFVCLLVIARGYVDLVRGVPGSSLPPGSAIGAPQQLGPTGSPYFLAQESDAGETFYRLRGLGEINDPNDFGQLIVCLIPLIFIFWRTKMLLLNIVCVILPVCALLYGIFLTHSRGALVALMAVAVMAARRRIGTLPALVVAGGLFVAATALHFTGGRDISASAGEDRTALWGTGLEMLKTHPLFGVGFGQFADYCGCGHTAHNSVVVCAAELGVFGLFFWALFLLPTVRDALAIASPATVSKGEPIVPEEGLLPHATRKIEALDKAAINRLGSLAVLSLTGFLVAGLFLSRAFVMTLFMLGGIVEVIYEMALVRGMIAPRLRLARVLPYAGILEISLVMMMYIMVRILNLMH